MGILGIRNRTENWKTARIFAPFFQDKFARAALARQLGESKDTPPGAIKVELYWRGMRDYIHQLEEQGKRIPTQQDFRQRYARTFPNLRDEIKDFDGLKLPNPWNYDPSKSNETERLYNNLRNPEIDIVVKTPKHLYIGEAKHESDFGRDGELVLVHQLIRQYVMATILTDMIAEATDSCPKKVIPFLVGNNLMRFDQVKFMIEQHKLKRSPGKWLRKENVLSWDCIEKLAPSGANKG